MTAPDFRSMGDPLNDRLPPARRSGNRADAADQVLQAELAAESLLARRRRKDLARIHRPAIDEEGTCTKPQIVKAAEFLTAELPSRPTDDAPAHGYPRPGGA